MFQEDVWYIIPAELVIGQGSIALYPKLKRAKYEMYREAWDLLRGGGRVDRMEACAEEGFAAEVATEDGWEWAGGVPGASGSEPVAGSSVEVDPTQRKAPESVKETSAPTRNKKQPRSKPAADSRPVGTRDNSPALQRRETARFDNRVPEGRLKRNVKVKIPTSRKTGETWGTRRSATE